MVFFCKIVKKLFNFLKGYIKFIPTSIQSTMVYPQSFINFIIKFLLYNKEWYAKWLFKLLYKSILYYAVA